MVLSGVVKTVRKKPRPRPPKKPLSVASRLVLEQNLNATLATRECGECTACCTAMAIRELDKPGLEPCAHVTCQGCSIYPDRPKSCREFLCAWRAGIGTDDQRPDRLGIVLSMTEPGHPVYPALLINEVWPDALRDNAAAVVPYIQDLASRMVLVLVRDGLPKSFAGPEDRIRALRPVIEESRRVNEAARKASAY